MEAKTIKTIIDWYIEVSLRWIRPTFCSESVWWSHQISPAGSSIYNNSKDNRIHQYSSESALKVGPGRSCSRLWRRSPQQTYALAFPKVAPPLITNPGRLGFRETICRFEEEKHVGETIFRLATPVTWCFLVCVGSMLSVFVLGSEILRISMHNFVSFETNLFSSFSSFPGLGGVFWMFCVLGLQVAAYESYET